MCCLLNAHVVVPNVRGQGAGETSQRNNLLAGQVLELDQTDPKQDDSKLVTKVAQSRVLLLTGWDGLPDIHLFWGL